MASSVQNKIMAARLKAEGVIRRTGRCALCNKIVAVPMDNHIRFHGADNARRTR